ncbi:MAG: helix-turn-helix transcriptional regulator, partial [Oscillibacter sp.]
MTLGEKIAKFRTEQHLSQGDLAEKMGVSRQSVSKWETGGSVPDLDKLVALSELFSVSLDALVKEQAETPPVSVAPPVSAPLPSAFPPRKIAGWILLAVGLLCAVLGLVLNLVLTGWGAYLGLCGIICLGVKRHPGLVIGWGTFLCCMEDIPGYPTVLSCGV